LRHIYLVTSYSGAIRDAALAGDLGDGWIHGSGIRVAHDF
jgi:hypothetical protein